MTHCNDSWARIDAVIIHAKLTTNSFAIHIGLSCGEVLYRIKRGINGISRDLAEKITQHYPEISIGWLMTGYGNMFTDEMQQAMQIPFYRGDTFAILMRRETLKPAYYMFMPQIPCCDFALELAGPPRYRKEVGKTIRFLQKFEEKNFRAGHEYVSVKENCITLHKLPKRPRTTGMKVADYDIVYIVKGKLTVY